MAKRRRNKITNGFQKDWFISVAAILVIAICGFVYLVMSNSIPTSYITTAGSNVTQGDATIHVSLQVETDLSGSFRFSVDGYGTSSGFSMNPLNESNFPVTIQNMKIEQAQSIGENVPYYFYNITVIGLRENSYYNVSGFGQFMSNCYAWLGCTTQTNGNNTYLSQTNRNIQIKTGSSGSIVNVSLQLSKGV